MSTNANDRPRWSTSSFGGTADTSPMELSALREHLQDCKASRGRMFALRCAAETFPGFAAQHLVTIVLLVVAVVLLAIFFTSLALGSALALPP